MKRGHLALRPGDAVPRHPLLKSYQLRRNTKPLFLVPRIYGKMIMVYRVNEPELRNTMQWPSHEFREYDKVPQEIDYANPDYYQQVTPHAVQPAQTLDKNTVLPPAYGYESTMMEEYRGPGSLEGYTQDAGAEQREAAARGSAGIMRKRGRVAGLISG